MARYIITLLLGLGIVAGAEGQPGIKGVHRVGNGTLLDVYATGDGGFAACGTIQGDYWIVRTDSTFQVLWSHSYRGDSLYSIVELDDGGFLAGGATENPLRFSALRVDADGQVIWSKDYGFGECNAVVELKNNDLALIGHLNQESAGKIVMTNPEGDVIWDRGFNPPFEEGAWMALHDGKETDGGLLTSGFFNGAGGPPWWLKVDYEGEVVWNHSIANYQDRFRGGSWGGSMASTTDGGYVTCHQNLGGPGGDVPIVFKIDRNGQLQWNQRFSTEGNWDGYHWPTICRYGDNGFAIELKNSANWPFTGGIWRITNEGEQRWFIRTFLRTEGIVFAHNGSLIACGAGILLEIEPEVIGPTIIDWLPPSTDLSLLPGDTLHFMIHAENQWGDSISYAFFRDNERIANDSAVTVLFDDLGEFLINGRAYSGGDSDQVVWNVDVAELHIIEHSPDILNLDVRQGGEIDFSIDSVLAVGGNEGVEYLWTRMNLDIEDEDLMGRDSSTTIAFPDNARYQVVGQAYRDDQSDEVVWNVHVRSGILDLGRVEIEVEPGHVGRLWLVIFNDEDTTLNWQSSVRVRGVSGVEPWTLRGSLPVAEATGDDRIEGVVFDGESYFCAGANGDDPNMIYQIDREGEVLGSFPQPGHSRYGFKDLEWDGELIWGSGEDSVFAMTRDGAVVYRWRASFSPTQNIAFDPESGILWLSGVTTEITAYDQVGNNLGQSLDRHGLRMYGLGWFPEDPDSACLYVVNSPTADSAQINKINVSSGEMQLVTAIQQDSAASYPFRGGFISRDYDRYQGWVMTTIADIPEGEGGDEIRVMQLQPNTEWLTVRPESGEIAAGERVDVEIIVRTSRWDGSWAFEEGEYEGEIVFTHDGEGGQDILPIYLIVDEPGGVDELGDGFRAPSSFKLLTPYPNPFNASTTVRFSLPVASQVRLTVHDITGRVVGDLTDKNVYPPGEHAVVWDGSGLAAGVYLVRLDAGGEAKTVKAVLVK